MQLPAAPIEIRPPLPPELARLREWMPRAFHEDGADPVFRVAVLGRHARLAAAAAVTPAGAESAKLFWRAADETFLRGDVLAPLFAAAATAAREALGARVLRTAAMLETAHPAVAALQGAGFEPGEAQEVFEINTQALHDYLDPLQRRLTQRGRIPADARVEPLRDEFLPAARQLFARSLPAEAAAEAPNRLLRGEEEGYRQADSFALLVGDALRGLLLRRKQGRISHTGAVLVAKALRGGSGWAHLLLLHRSNVASLADGTETGWFTADARLHRITLNFARHIRAQNVGRRMSYLLRLR